MRLATVPSEVTGVECLDCRQVLPTARPDDPAEGRPPCPSCGSLRRNIKVAIHEEVRLETHLDTHSRHPRPDYRGGRRSKPAMERRAGDVQSADGVWRKRRQLIDRAGDWYEETVLNPDGSLYHYEAHRLSEHKGHGSDKPKG